MDKKILLKKYKAKKSSTIGRLDKNRQPIEFRLSFDEWCMLWEEFGQYPKQPWVLSRKNDLGHYELGNVFIQHNVDNAIDSYGRNPDDYKINQYSFETGYSRRIVKNMIKRGQLIL